MRSRIDRLAVAVLAVLAAGVTSASATLALREVEGRAAAGPAARLPDVLFSAEPPAPVAPVQLEASPEGEGAEAPVQLAAPSPRPSQAQPRPARSSAPAPAAPRLTVALSFAMSRVQARSLITYTATLRNEGPSLLQGLRVASHVPDGTRWRNDAPCRGESRPLTLAYGGGAPVVICAPVPSAGDGSGHEVVAVFDRPIPPGGTATASFTVRVERGVTSVENHVHVEGSGIRADSQTLVTKVTS